MNELIAKIWELKQAPVLDQVLLKTYSNQLISAALKAYGVTIDVKKIDWSAKNSKTVASILNNTWQFSGAKTYTQLRDIGAALIDADGNYKTEKQFIEDAQAIAKTHINWLKVERNTALGGAQMIALWQKIQDEKDLFPLLEFDAVLDTHTTAICETLHGTVKPVDDPFWDKYYPLNHFNCRSTVRRLRTGKITPDNDLIIPENIPKMFRTNFGKTGIVFPKEHAYFKGTPEEISNAEHPAVAANRKQNE